MNRIMELRGRITVKESRTGARNGTVILCVALALSALPASLGGNQNPPEQARDSRTTPEQDVAALHVATEQGDPTSQNSLGNAYADGTGVPEDVNEAVRWFRLAAGQGFAYLFSGFQRGKRPSQWGEARDGSRSSTYGCGERSKATRCGTGSLSC